jgi:DNA mismatch repair protein MutL
MSKIQILPENLANQIAAGEVIERPASVVKELVENAIDAGASQIDIQVAGGGTRLIRIIDDGEGMDQDDILLCLERHATSKLSTADQLTSINTLGFRGEAIPSISSVSRMTITSRTASSSLGIQAEIRFGQVRKVHDMGCAKGTVIEIRDLFGNVPARKKFLKTTRTELNHIEEVAVNSALARPHIGFRYTVDGKTMFSFSPGNDSPQTRMKQLTSWSQGVQLIKVDHSHEEQGRIFAIHGYLLPPEVSIPGTAKLRIFVNSRSIRDRMISHAVTEGMHAFLMKGKRPVGILLFEIPPEEVDVNVHPTKQEIRFHKPSLLHDLVVRAVSEGMEKYQDDVKYTVFGKPGAKKDIPYSEEKIAEHRSESSSMFHSVKPSFEVNEETPLFDKKEVPRLRVPQSSTVDEYIAEQKEEVSIPAGPAAINKQSKEESHIGLLKYIGQIHGSYLLCASENGLVVVDQHAAHERLLFETLKKQYTSRKMTGQALLFPEVIECTPEQEHILKSYQEEIRNLGIDIGEFGGNSYVIKAIPAILSHIGPLEVVQGVFDRYLASDMKTKGAPTGIDDILSLMACKAAVKANHELLPVEGSELLKKMEEADIFSHCPHGRPVMIRFSRSDIEKWFYR